MRLFIVGATGGIGRHLVKLGLERGHIVTAFARSPGKIEQTNDRLTVIQGDLFNAAELGKALAGHDIALSAFGPTTIRTTTLRRDFGQAFASAVVSSGVRRLQLVSAAFLFEEVGLLGAILKPTLFRYMMPDMAAMEREVMRNDLDWTIVRPPRLTNGAATCAYRVANGVLPRSGTVITRSDVADFMIREAEQPAHAGNIVGVCR